MFKFRKSRKKKRQTDIVVVDLPAADGGPAGVVKGTRVGIYRPPVLLDAAGRTMAGVNKDLVARYLVSTVAAMADTDLGPVAIEWKGQEGRFVNTSFLIHAWGQEVEIVHPVAPVSQKLANAWEVYKAGVALKVQELHKGHQQFGEANALITRASRNLDRLRDDRVPHFTDAEYMFLQAAFQGGIVLSALIPVGSAGAEVLVGQAVNVG